MNPIEHWARENFKVETVDSIAHIYFGDGPPSWRQPRPELRDKLDPRNPADWWWKLCLMEFRRIVRPEMRVLDLGCGPGWPSIPLSRHVREIVAIDASDLAISLIQKELKQKAVSNVQVKQCDAAKLPFDDESFDAVVAGDLMDVVTDADAVAREMFRALKPGGQVVSTVQNFRHILGGKSESHLRSVVRSGGQLLCTYHYASLRPPQSFDLCFSGTLTPSLARHFGNAPEITALSPDVIFSELRAIRSSFAAAVEMYETQEFTPETAAAPFEAAGFGEVTVSPLSMEMCRAFAEDLQKRNALPQTEEQFESHISTLLAAMRHADFDKSAELSVTARKP